jgi:hypothetical protein
VSAFIEGNYFDAAGTVLRVEHNDATAQGLEPVMTGNNFSFFIPTVIEVDDTVRTTIDVTDNNWGTSLLSDIEARIIDNTQAAIDDVTPEDGQKGKVIYGPIASGPFTIPAVPDYP